MFELFLLIHGIISGLLLMNFTFELKHFFFVLAKIADGFDHIMGRYVNQFAAIVHDFAVCWVIQL